MRRLSSSPARSASCTKVARDVLLHGALADRQPLADPLVRASLGDQREHLALARGQRRQRPDVMGAREQTGHNLRVERGAPRGYAPERADEVVNVGHAVLEEVAESLGALGEDARSGPDL